MPVVYLEEILAEYGYDWLAEVAEWNAAGASDPWYEVVVRLDAYLPAGVVDFYGLDAH